MIVIHDIVQHIFWLEFSTQLNSDFDCIFISNEMIVNIQKIRIMRLWIELYLQYTVFLIP